ncbi:MAG: glycosyltransferase family 9 protein [Planctomycetaceae bacterium]|jgi:ADP-heptose:LPS heptosyltransferase|nr:glycosyltransferase family 9 protein [Planctomycetaceae bacterium]
MLGKLKRLRANTTTNLVLQQIGDVTILQEIFTALFLQRQLEYFTIISFDKMQHYLNNVKRILVVQLNTVSGIVYSLPALNALRLRFPTCELAWLVDDRIAPLLFGHNALDRLIIAKENWLSSFDETNLLRRRLLAFSPDAAVDLQGTFMSALAAWLSGAKHRIGFGGIGSNFASRMLNNIRIVPADDHVVIRKLQLLEAFGIVGGSIDFDLPESETDIYNARQKHNRLNLGTDFVAMSISTENAVKQWDERGYAEIVYHLNSQWNLMTLILWNTESERQAAERIVKMSDGAAVILDETTIGVTISLIKMSTLFIGNNTDMLHIAAVADTPCIGLYNVQRTSQNTPFGTQNRVLRIEQVRNSTTINTEITKLKEICDELLQRETTLREQRESGQEITTKQRAA